MAADRRKRNEEDEIKELARGVTYNVKKRVLLKLSTCFFSLSLSTLSCAFSLFLSCCSRSSRNPTPVSSILHYFLQFVHVKIKATHKLSSDIYYSDSTHISDTHTHTTVCVCVYIVLHFNGRIFLKSAVVYNYRITIFSLFQQRIGTIIQHFIFCFYHPEKCIARQKKIRSIHKKI